MAIQYKYYVDKTGRATNLSFTPSNYIVENGWKVGDCVNDELPDINTLHELKYLDAQALIQYKEDRQAEYPTIPEQLDEIYHNGIDSWKAVIKVTKDKYPKG